MGTDMNLINLFTQSLLSQTSEADDAEPVSAVEDLATENTEIPPSPSPSDPVAARFESGVNKQEMFTERNLREMMPSTSSGMGAIGFGPTDEITPAGDENEQPEINTDDVMNDLKQSPDFNKILEKYGITEEQFKNALDKSFNEAGRTKKTNPNQPSADKKHSLSEADKAFLEKLNKDNERAMKRIMIEYARLKLQEERQKWQNAMMAGNLAAIRDSIKLASSQS